MKRDSVSFDQSHVVDDEVNAKVKYQSLLKEYLELQKVFVSKKRKLQAAKQRGETILAEVRFLRRRHKYLFKIKASNTEKDPLHLQNIKNDEFEGEINQRSPMAPAENSNPISKSHLEDEGGKGEEQEVLEEEVGFSEEPNKYLIHNKGVGKRNIFLPNEVNLKV